MKLLRLSANNQSGFILVSAIIAVGVLVFIGFGLISSTNSQNSVNSKNIYRTNAVYAAEAGAEQTLRQLNLNDNFGGFPTEQVFFNNSTQGRSTYTSTITPSPSDANAKIITSTAKVYKRATDSTPTSTRIVKVTVVGTSSPGYAVHTGPGGLILSGSANITNADVYVNGTVLLSGNAKIGTTGQPLSVNVAHNSCPTGASPGATYPTQCTSGNPITLGSSSRIFGTVCATNQINSSGITGGSTGQGLKPNCVAPPVAPPTYDRASHIAAVTTNGTAANYNCSGSINSKIWPANLKIAGNLSIGNNCTITIKGNTYITGDLDIGGTSKIIVDESAGAVRPVIIVDGKITINGSAELIANSMGTSLQFTSFKSTSACNPNCTTLSGNELKTSSIAETVNVGGSAKLPGMIFQAYWGKITVGGSGKIGSVIGQTVDLSGSGTITFGTTLSSGSQTWTVTSYQQKFAP